jgi:DNA-binding CsgD family transcriptional regulator
LKTAYTQQHREEAIKLAKEVGPYKASQSLGIGLNTIKRWMDPERTKRENEANASRRRVPCDICGKPTSKYGRRHPELGLLCHEHVMELLADEERGYAVDELAKMRSDGLSTNEIAHEAGMTQSAVHALLTRHGVPTRTREEAAEIRGPGASHRGKLDPEEVFRLRDEGMSQPKIAAKLGVSVSSIQYHLKRRPETV